MHNTITWQTIFSSIIPELLTIINTKTPIVLYVGKTFARRNLKDRLKDHFGGKKLNFQGSQFRKFLMQVCQDEETVKKVLWSENTLIAHIAIEESDEVIDFI